MSLTVSANRQTNFQARGDTPSPTTQKNLHKVFCRACFQGDREKVKSLMGRVNLNDRDDQGFAPLHHAAKGDQDEIINDLWKGRADFFVKTTDGIEAQHLTSEHCAEKIYGMQNTQNRCEMLNRQMLSGFSDIKSKNYKYEYEGLSTGNCPDVYGAVNKFLSYSGSAYIIPKKDRVAFAQGYRLGEAAAREMTASSLNNESSTSNKGWIDILTDTLCNWLGKILLRKRIVSSIHNGEFVVLPTGYRNPEGAGGHRMSVAFYKKGKDYFMAVCNGGPNGGQLNYYQTIRVTRIKPEEIEKIDDKTISAILDCDSKGKDHSCKFLYKDLPSQFSAQNPADPVIRFFERQSPSTQSVGNCPVASARYPIFFALALNNLDFNEKETAQKELSVTIRYQEFFNQLNLEWLMQYQKKHHSKDSPADLHLMRAASENLNNKLNDMNNLFSGLNVSSVKAITTSLQKIYDECGEENFLCNWRKEKLENLVLFINARFHRDWTLEDLYGELKIFPEAKTLDECLNFIQDKPRSNQEMESLGSSIKINFSKMKRMDISSPASISAYLRSLYNLSVDDFLSHFSKSERDKLVSFINAKFHLDWTRKELDRAACLPFFASSLEELLVLVKEKKLSDLELEEFAYMARYSLKDPFCNASTLRLLQPQSTNVQPQKMDKEEKYTVNPKTGIRIYVPPVAYNLD